LLFFQTEDCLSQVFRRRRNLVDQLAAPCAGQVALELSLADRKAKVSHFRWLLALFRVECVQIGCQISLPEVGQHCDDSLPGSHLGGHFQGRPTDSSRRDAAKDSFLARQTARSVLRMLMLDGNDAIDYFHVED